MTGLVQDLRVTLRTLRQRPGFALLTILTLAVGGGATTAIFTLISGVLLKPLAYQDPESLITVHVQTEKYGDRWGFSYPDFLDCRRECRSFENVAAWTYSGGTVSAPGQAEYVDGRQVSSDLFSVLRVPLARGRSFLPAEDHVGGAPVAIISTNLWQRRYGADPNTIGMALTYEGKDYTVVGIAPAGFQLDGDVDVFTPVGQATEPRMQNRSAHFMHVVARLRQGITLSQAQEDLSLISRQLAKQYPDSNDGITMVPYPLQTRTGSRRQTHAMASLPSSEPCLADRLRECRKHAANACGFTPARIRVASCAGRSQRAPPAPVLDRKRCPRNLRRPVGAIAGCGRHRPVCQVLARPSATRQ